MFVSVGMCVDGTGIKFLLEILFVYRYNKYNV